MAIDFNKIFAQNGQKVELTDEQYLTGWGYLGSGATGQAPSYQTFNYYMNQVDQKLKLLKDTSGQINLRKDNTTYALGDTVLSATLPSWAFAECTTAGTTGVGEPLWSSATVGQTFTDGSCVWKIKDIKMAEKVNLSDFTQSLTANGWQKLPSGLIIQWGTLTAIATSGGWTQTITLPTAFLTAGFAAYGNYKSNITITGGYPVDAFIASNSQITLSLDAVTSTEPTGSQSIYWLALGF